MEDDPAAPPEGPAWVEAAIHEALEWETPPMAAQVDAARPPELRSFFLAHPEYEEPARRAALADLACAFGTEEAHTRLMNPTPATPKVVELSDSARRLVLAHASVWCTRDGWSWFAYTVGETLKSRGIRYEYAGPEHNELVLRRGTEDVGRYPLSGQGYLAVEVGREPLDVRHSRVQDVLPAFWSYYGLE